MASPQDTRVVRAAIHPAIGVARLGNSASEYFIGPQIIPTPTAPLGSFRDQAARTQAAGRAVPDLRLQRRR